MAKREGTAQGRGSVDKLADATEATLKMSDNKPVSARRKSSGEEEEAVLAESSPGDLKTIFFDFCNFGGSGKEKSEELDNPKFGKFCRETGVIDKKFSSTSADLVFTKVKEKGKRTLNYSQFQEALKQIAGKYFTQFC